jgi:hypothetical protein
MSVPLIKYPLDLTGAAPSNLVTGEIHDLSALSQKAFVLNYGPFYTGNLVIRNNATGQVLTPRTQYVATQLFIDVTLRTGLDVCSVIVITDTTLPMDLVVSVDAQMVGGEYSASVDAIQQLIDALNLGNQPVTWADILGKPVLFPPAPHLHDLGDVYGFEYIVAALERITQAIYVGDDAQLQAIYAYIDHEISGLQGSIASTAAELTAHLADYTNPHRTTAAEVGLGNVNNYGTATNAQGLAGTATNLYMTPASTTAATGPINTALNAHISNIANPHQTNATQVGLGLVQNFGLATTALAQAGTNNASYMTPALTAAAISQQALVPLNAHINNTSNPHQVSKAQVALGNVNNYGTATAADGQAGTSTVLYMTPASTAAGIQAQVGNGLAAHIANLGNPHQVTKTQVGLGNVQNYAMASGADGAAGTSGTLYMSPASTTGAINSQVLGPLNAHINNINNPHQVNATQVGLGQVNNTADVNKPVSNPQQAALNAKASIGSSPEFGAVSIGTNGIYLYESAAGAFSIRSGTAAGFWYSTFDASGNLSIGGTLYASRGFQPSDKRLKKHIKKIDPRPLWRELNFKEWDWKNPKDGGHDVGVIAQDVQAVAPEYVDFFNPHGRRNVMGVDKVALSMELAFAAGNVADDAIEAVDDLKSQLNAQGAQITELLKVVKRLSKGG